jgi:FAD/FMN-containing dehydrogenase
LRFAPDKEEEMAGPFKELKDIFCPDGVLDDPKTLEAYSKDESFVRPQMPRCVVKAQNATQVQELVQWANRTLTPLVPLSSGPPHFRGDSVPGAPGEVVVDLSGMNKIIRVNERNRMVIIEPGVTYAQLQPELAKHGLRLSSPLAPRSCKSVIGALLEREPITTPRFQWGMLDPLRCTEVIWGEGQKMTTGETESTEALEEEWTRHLAQVIPFGPGQTNYYKFTSAAQGSMGIVTWASVKCELLPRIHKLFFVPAPELEDLMDLTYSILRIRFGDEILIMNNWNVAMLLGKDADQTKAVATQLPRWVLMIGIAGREQLPEERVAYQEKDISEMAMNHGLRLLPGVSGADDEETLQTILNPCAESYWKLTLKGGCQDLFFLNTLNRSPEFVKTAYAAAESQLYPASEIGVYIQPVQQGASCHIEFNFPFDPGDSVEAGKVERIYRQASKEMLELGAYYSRPYGIWASMAFVRDPQTASVLRKIKEIFDPNKIMNPGKLCF